MENYFITSMHEERFLELMAEDDTSFTDIERVSLFYILAGNNELYKKRRHIYDSNRHGICACFENRDVDFSSGMGALIKLGFNLYNGWPDGDVSPRTLLGCLDDYNLELAQKAMLIRFHANRLEGMFV